LAVIKECFIFNVFPFPTAYVRSGRHHGDALLGSRPHSESCKKLVVSDMSDYVCLPWCHLYVNPGYRKGGWGRVRRLLL